MADPLIKVVQSGDRRQSLEAIRDRLASELDEAEGRDVAPIAKELRNVIDTIEALPGAREGSKSDDLAAQRAKRRAQATR
jgi:hypothetical protein